MKETILLVPSVSGAELQRTLARYGFGTFNTRIMGETAFAEYALMRSGVLISREILSAGKAAAVIFGVMKSTPLFREGSFADAQKLYSTLSSVRRLIETDEAAVMRQKLINEADGFEEANKALFEVYERYTAELEARGKLDPVSYLRYACENVREGLDIEVRVLEEYPASPLAMALAVKLCGRVENVSICSLLPPAKQGGEISLTACYGSINEARGIISEILQSGRALDECTVACAETNALPLAFYELSKELDIDISFGCGLPISASYPAILLRHIAYWCGDGLYGVSGLRAMLFSQQFDRDKLYRTLGIYDDLHSYKKGAENLRYKAAINRLNGAVRIIGELRLTFADAPQCENSRRLSDYRSTLKQGSPQLAALELAQQIAAELEKGIVYILKTYAKLRVLKTARTDENGQRKGDDLMLPLDSGALSVICDELSVCQSSAECITMLPYIMKKRVLTECSRERALHVCSIPAALASLRPELFIAGMSASSYPGSPKENYLLLDVDMQRFGEAAPISKKLTADKKQSYRSLFAAAKQVGCNIHLSYPYYDTAELKDINASSLLFDSISGENVKPVTQSSYFPSVLFASDKAAQFISQGQLLKMLPRPAEQLLPIGTPVLINVSGLPTYFYCQKQFFYEQVLKLSAPTPDDPLKVAPPAVLGDLFHDELMKPFSDAVEGEGEDDHINKPLGERISEERFVSLAGSIWDDYLKRRPPLNISEAERLGREFEDMARAEYGYSKYNKKLSGEQTVKLEYGCFKLIGKYDCIEEQPEVGRVVVDYKTGLKEEHKPGDFGSNIQLMIYAYMLDDTDQKVIGGEFRCVRTGQSIFCKYDDKMKERVREFLNELSDKISGNSFERAANFIGDPKCRSCKHREYCHRKGNS